MISMSIIWASGGDRKSSLGSSATRTSHSPSVTVPNVCDQRDISRILSGTVINETMSDTSGKEQDH
jgi:hypothetical protein